MHAGWVEPGWGERDAGSLRAHLRPIARAVRGVLWRARAARVLSGPAAPRGEVRVYFGFRQLPGAETVTVGGLVKVLALDGVFPNTPRGFNVLYLVSSRLPDGAVELARAARRKGVRVVVNQNGVAYPGWYGRGWELVNAPMAELIGLADHVFYQSDFCRMAADLLLGSRPASSETLYNAVDTAAFTPSGERRNRSGLTLLLAGSQDRSYRVRAAINVLAQVARHRHDVRLVVTGRLGWMPTFEDSRRLALSWAEEQNVADRMTFAGPYRQVEAVEIFRSADILLHTKYADPCPTVVLEAMACGLPVVYSATGGVPELVGPDAGVGVPGELRWDEEVPPDPDGLTEGVLTVAERIGTYSDAARQRAVERFDVRPWLQRHTQVFEHLVA